MSEYKFGYNESDDGVIKIITERDEIRQCLSDLVKAIERVNADPKYRSVWEISQVHFGPYTGENYISELLKAQDILNTKLCTVLEPRL